MIVYSPLNEIALRNILYTSQFGLNHPIAIRYPRGRGQIVDWQKPYEKIEIGEANCLKKGSKIAVLSNGTIGNNVTSALAQISNPEVFAHYDFAFVKPLDENLLHRIFKEFKTIITIEDGVVKGGFGSAILEFSAQNNYTSIVKTLGIPDEFIEQGTVEELQQYCKIDVKSLESIFSSY
jgi:1-deoxy-D-xylulose-5-phosphate synthase